MRLRLVSAGLVLLAAAAPAAKHPARPRQTVKADGLFASASLANWYNVDNASAEDRMPQAPPKKLNTTPVPDGAEQITVYGRRGPDLDRAWREEMRDRTPVYEAGASDAAQPMYAHGPEWSSPEEMQTMSSIKSQMGLCGPPLSCPGL